MTTTVTDDPYVLKVRREISDLDRSLVGNTHAKTAIDCALHDLRARRLGISTCELFATLPTAFRCGPRPASLKRSSA